MNSGKIEDWREWYAKHKEYFDLTNSFIETTKQKIRFQSFHELII